MKINGARKYYAKFENKCRDTRLNHAKINDIIKDYMR